MKIGIDARFITRQPRRGIGNYSLNLVNELVRLDKNIQYVLYIDEPDGEGVLPDLPNVTVRLLSSWGYPFFENLSLPFAVMKDELDILHCLGNTAPIFLPSNVQLVISIMDVMFLKNDSFLPIPKTYYQKLGRLYRSILVPFAARYCNKIITISEFSRNDILRNIQGIVEKDVSVAHISCDPLFINFSAKNVTLNNQLINATKVPFVLCLGAEDPRKNTLRLIRSYLSLVKINAINENLLICGYANWEKSESFKAVKDAKAENRITFLKFVTIVELATLYRKATAFVYPSLYEGFGIPVLEAFSSGCPVIASNLTSIPEVAGDAAIYFDPLNEGNIAQALHLMLSSASLRNKMKERGFERIKKFNWVETARKTLCVYFRCMLEIRP